MYIAEGGILLICTSRCYLHKQSI
uniref:Uncharacterized protein n=1 Tax=Arundo donax TaxID=35708 RepID=A0A0A8XZ93_ARUDO